MSLLTARGISVSYGALQVLHDADLVVAAGDRIAVAGPNGVGKSTLLLVLAGLVPPDAGTVRAAGTVATCRKSVTGAATRPRWSTSRVGPGSRRRRRPCSPGPTGSPRRARTAGRARQAAARASRAGRTRAARTL